MPDSEIGTPCAEGLNRIGKGVVQANLRLSRALELLQAASPAGAPPGADDGAALEILLDTLDAVAAAGGDRAGEGRRWSFWRRRASKSEASMRRGLEVAFAAAVDRLKARQILPTAEEGRFDPEVHEAVERLPTRDAAQADSIARTHRRGWHRARGGERIVLRRALVSVYGFEEEAQ